MRKSVYAIYEQQRHRSTCASAQSEQRLCCSLPRWFNTSCFYIRNFKPLPSSCDCAGRFESTLVTRLNFSVSLQQNGMNDAKSAVDLAIYVNVSFVDKYMGRLMTKPTEWSVRPAKTQTSLGIRPAWSESSLSALRKPGSSATHWAQSEGSDQTGRMPRLIWVFAGHTCHSVVLSCCGPFSVSLHRMTLMKQSQQ